MPFESHGPFRGWRRLEQDIGRAWGCVGMRDWHNYWHTRQNAARRVLRRTHAYRLLGERIFHHHLWAVDVRSVSGAVALGLFVAFTPTIPFQMILCAIGATLLRVNLPIALACCWVTNPLTALPIYVCAYRVGKHLLSGSAVAEYVRNVFGYEGRLGLFLEKSLHLWAGALLFACAAAVLGRAVARIIGRWIQCRQARRITRVHAEESV